MIASAAYTYWLYYTLIDTKINVAHFMIKSDKLQPKKTADIVTTLGAATTAKPAAKVPPKALTAPTQAGAAEGWHDPLDSCSLRTAGLASVKSATFGMVRIDKFGKPKAHQGIDLKADPGTPIYAVANGKVSAIKSVDEGDYGKTITLMVDIQDLPQHQRDLVLAKNPDAKVVYFFYAHLSEINVKVSTNLVVNGTVLGASGHTGNAKKMTVVSKGAHLHFEVRFVKGKAGLGLVHRMDPKPLINNCN